MRILSRKNDYNEKTFTGLRFVSVAYFFVFTSALSAANNNFGIAVDGACKTGTSCPATPLPYNADNTLPVTYTFTLANGDKYLIDGSSTGSNNSNGGYLPLTTTFQVTYEGNGVGGVSQADAITIDWYAAFETTYGYGNFGEGLSGAFGRRIARSSSAKECVNGGSCLGPVTPPKSFSESTTFSENSSNGAFMFDVQWTLNFGAGSPVGAYIVLGATAPLRAPKINYFSPTTGDAGVASVTINGRNFTGANSVTLHNTAASFTVVSDTQIAATVPCTATAGPIEVATPGGSARSQGDFTVTGKCYSAAEDFSLKSNPHGAWSYGYATSPGQPFQLLATPANPCGYPDSGFECWWDGDQIPESVTVYYNPGAAPLSINNVILPHNMLGLDGEDQEAIVRWTAPAAGTYSINGSFNGIGATGCGQNSVNVGVYQDETTTLAQGNISSYGQQVAFSLPNLVLTAGATIDFTEDLANSYSCDGTGLIAAVALVSP
jgi:hypothetical protein